MNDVEQGAAEPNPAGITDLLATVGCKAKFTLQPLTGGRNNRTYHVRSEPADYLLKWYFSHHNDQRNRLATEFDFCRTLWQHGIRRVPQPLARDQAAGWGLYEFLPGRPPAPGDVTPADHDQALAFLRDINAVRFEPDVLSLPAASEACFSLASHVARIDQRLEDLAAVVPTDPSGREMVDLIRTELRPAFGQQSAELERQARRAGLDIQSDLPLADRVLSPSDFGFHNALRQNDCALRFVDFEYAGWDDPAKLVGDFFCQVEVPALANGFDGFLTGVAASTAHPEISIQRSRWLFPLYQIKWCCIVLNEFLPAGDARRAFSAADVDESKRREQLALARRLLALVGCVPGSA